MNDLKFDTLSALEEQWVRGQLDQAREFAQAYVPGLPDRPLSLGVLDQAFGLFLADHQARDANAAIMAVGTAFGDSLVKELGFGWMIATDDYGTELAVLARPGRGDVTIFPNDFVSKRYERGETPFLVDALTDIRETLREIAAEWGDPV